MSSIFKDIARGNLDLVKRTLHVFPSSVNSKNTQVRPYRGRGLALSTTPALAWPT